MQSSPALQKTYVQLLSPQQSKMVLKLYYEEDFSLHKFLQLAAIV